MSRRLIALVFAVVAAGAALTALAAVFVDGFDGVRTPIWALVVAYLAVGRLSVEFEVRGERFSSTFGLAILVFGMLDGRGVQVVLAAAAAELIDWALHPRQNPLKGVYAVGIRLLDGAVAVLIFGLVGGQDVNSLRAWAVALVAALIADTVCTVATAGVVSLAAGQPMRADAPMLTPLSIAAVNVLLGTLAFQVVLAEPWALWTIAGLAAVLHLVHKAYGKLRQRYGSLNLLHEFSHGLAGLTETDDVAATALASAKELLRAEQAYIVFALPDGVAVRMLDSHGNLQTSVDRSGYPPAIAQILHVGASVLVDANDTNSPQRKLCDQLGVRDLVAAEFLADGVRGMLVVAGRLSDVSTFDDEDAKVLTTFAQHTSVALTVGELVDRLRLEVVDREFQAMHDAITGLPNRTRLLVELQELIDDRGEGAVAVLLMDLDAFKDVNDTLGHTTGDALLQEIGRRLSAAIGSRGTVARLGGDEFAVCLADMSGPEAILEFVEGIRGIVEAPYVVDRLSLVARFSIGVAVSPDHGIEPKVLLQRADIAMYVAKEHRIGTSIYAPELDKSSTRRLALAGELAAALDHREFQLFYQPQLDLSTGSVMAIEALARWPHPEFKSVPPDEFIPLVEQTGLIGKFTDWALDSALRDIALWRETWPELRVSVNMSARNLNDPGFAASVRSLLAEHELGGEALTLELTESTVMGDPDRALEVLSELHGLGIRIAIDDFGTGYSSLSYLKKLPVDEVKIDKSFVMNMIGDDDDISIVRSTIDLARSLGMDTVAEGVESAAAVVVLGELGCSAAQGYYLSRPIPSADVADKIRSLHASYRQIGNGPAEELRRATIRQFSDLRQ